MLRNKEGRHPYIGSFFLSEEDISWMDERYKNDTLVKFWKEEDLKKMKFLVIDAEKYRNSNVVMNLTAADKIAHSYMISKPSYSKDAKRVVFYVGKFKTRISTNTFIYGDVVIMHKRNGKWHTVERLSMDFY